MKIYINIMATIFAIGLTIAFLLGPCALLYGTYVTRGLGNFFAAGLIITMMMFFLVNVVWFSVVKAWRENITFGDALYKLI